MRDDPNMLEAALLRTMTLLASLNVAVDIAFGMRERKAGRDPSTEESRLTLLPELTEDLETLKAILFQLQSSLAISDEAEPPPAGTVNRFVDLVRLQKAGRILHRIHQRLLSMYPEVEASIIEESRRLKNSCDQLQDVEGFDELGEFVDRAWLHMLVIKKQVTG